MNSGSCSQISSSCNCPITFALLRFASEFLFPVTVLISWMAPNIFDDFWSILLTNSYDIQLLSSETSIICRPSHLNTHTTTNTNFQDMRQRLASSSTHPCSEPRYINENVILKRTSLLTPLSNVNFGVSPSEIFFYTCYCLLDRRPEKTY